MITRILIGIPAGVILAFAALGVHGLVNAPDYCPNLATLARDGVVVWTSDTKTHCIPIQEYRDRAGEALP